MPKPCQHAEHAPGCRVCHLYHADPHYRARWDGTPPPPRLPPFPCVHEGAILEFATCGDPAKHVRDCDKHERCTRGPGRIKACAGCDDYDAGPGVVEFHTSAAGIGDTVTGVYAACGLADAGHRVVYHARNVEWVAGVSHPGVVVQPFAGRAKPPADANAHYLSQLKAGAEGAVTTRAQWYADRVCNHYGLGRVRPSRPQAVPTPAPVFDPGYVLFAPYSHWAGREWPAGRWAEVVRGVVKAGRRAVVIGSRRDGERIRADFGGVPCSFHWGMPSPWVLGAIAHAERVYANDSGPAHLAGLYGVPCTAVVSHLPGSFLFGEAPTVEAVSPTGWPCSPCGWQADRGYQTACKSSCAALASIPAGRVPLPVLA